MLSEAIERLAKLGVQAEGPLMICESACGRIKHYEGKEGRFVIDVGPSPLKAQVQSLNDLCEYAAKMEASETPQYSVWHNFDCVTLVCDDELRRDFVYFQLRFTEQYDALVSMAEGDDRLGQADFVRLLNRCLGVDAATVQKFRKLDFRVIQTAEGEIDHQKDRMGKSVAAEVKGTSDLPTDLLLNIPIYDNLDERDCEQIRCSIDLDAQRSQILMRPFPQELRNAVDMRQKCIRDRLVTALGEDARIYWGKP